MVIVDPEIIIIPVVFAIPAAVALARMWFKHKEKMAELGAGNAPTTDLESRLERIEHAIDAMAVEMERIGEGQRYLTKVLAEPQTGRISSS